MKTLLLWLAMVTIASATIDSAEFFFDTDPGIGNGTPVTLTPGVTDFTVPSSALAALSPGVHQLTLRYQDNTPTDTIYTWDPATGAVVADTIAGSDWSVAFSRSILIVADPPITAAGETTYGEYVIELDGAPASAMGTGTEIPLGALVGPDRTVSIAVPPSIIDSLTPGSVYNMSFRFQDSLGNWSIPSSRPFLVPPIPEPDGMVTKGEYTLSAADGSSSPAILGSGEMLMLPERTDGVRTLSAVVPGAVLETLDPGSYQITIRFQDDEGNWSIPKTRTFLLPESVSVLDSGEMVTLGEYFVIPDDGTPMPALGTGVPLTLPAAVDGEFTLSTTLPGSAFGDMNKSNFHVGFRFQDDNGAWSMTETRATVIPETVSATLVARTRYKITDPDDALVKEGVYGDTELVSFPADLEDIVTTDTLAIDPDPYTLEVFLVDNDGLAIPGLTAPFTMVTHRDLWDAIYFTDPGDRSNELISGPFADPNNDGIPNLLAFVLGLDPLSDAACTLDLVQLTGETNLSPLSQIPTVMPPGVDLSLRALDDLPISGKVWTYDTDIDVAPELIDTVNFSLVSPVETTRSDRLNVHAVMSGTRLRHFFDLCAELTGTWPYIYPLAP